RHPLVVRHQSLYLGLGELAILGVDLLVQVLFRGLAPGLRLSLLLQQFAVRRERPPLVGVEGVLANVLQPRLHGLCGDLLLVTLPLDTSASNPSSPLFSSRISSSCCSSVASWLSSASMRSRSAMK